MIDFTNPTAIKDYFEALAASHVDIDNFVFGDKLVMGNDVRSTEYGTILWLDYHQPVQLIDRKSDDIEGRIPDTLMILKVAPELFEDQESAVDDTEIIVRDIISKLYKDNQEGEITTELDGYKFGETEVTFGSTRFIGTRLDFNLIRPEKLIYNQAKWQ